ncbi:hypothetical protein BU24DRAFT_47895 [Aaosphaeria arxii CBS 175.79]|uniref:Killer toxin Kp4 domain-containing protein n=1 Tax=Aaosphaeria arxii CBS 175.79 TaxID=1450172 RepID=A0A6A5XDD4_9PLEO|nr:uncharacterized protein BU24DRAFT_47895 [Aaosphaeria arxii CBS 175.79]KAF2010873.1 hypothetical protein BU24DRAFT_47895 [Aaosphaeria arxii CBS 175.79]
MLKLFCIIIVFSFLSFWIPEGRGTLMLSRIEGRCICRFCFGNKSGGHSITPGQMMAPGGINCSVDYGIIDDAEKHFIRTSPLLISVTRNWDCSLEAVENCEIASQIMFLGPLKIASTCHTYHRHHRRPHKVFSHVNARPTLTASILKRPSRPPPPPNHHPTNPSFHPTTKRDI